MVTEILRPRDCLIQQIRNPPAAFSRRRTYTSCSNYYYNNHAATSRSYRKPVTRPDQRKRVISGSGQPVAVAVAVSGLKRSSADDSRMAKSSGSAMEKVTLLRRGQSLDSASTVAVKSDVYAGSAFSVVAPSPSALPLPSFPTKKQPSPAFDDSATRDLRRLLRLE